MGLPMRVLAKVMNVERAYGPNYLGRNYRMAIDKESLLEHRGGLSLMRIRKVCGCAG